MTPHFIPLCYDRSLVFFFFSSRRRHTIFKCDWSSDVCSSDLAWPDRINGEMLDTIDEELEMEIDDDRLAKLLTEIAEHPQPETLDRRVYFKELLRLQGELVKLQDWIVQHKLKLVGLFEGRHPAGNCAAIKTDTHS